MKRASSVAVVFWSLTVQCALSQTDSRPASGKRFEAEFISANDQDFQFSSGGKPFHILKRGIVRYRNNRGKLEIELSNGDVLLVAVGADEQSALPPDGVWRSLRAAASQQRSTLKSSFDKFGNKTTIETKESSFQSHGWPNHTMNLRFNFEGTSPPARTNDLVSATDLEIIAHGSDIYHWSDADIEDRKTEFSKDRFPITFLADGKLFNDWSYFYFSDGHDEHLRFRLPWDTVKAIASARSVEVKLCIREFKFTQANLAAFREIVEYVESHLKE